MLMKYYAQAPAPGMHAPLLNTLNHIGLVVSLALVKSLPKQGSLVKA